MFRKVNSPTFLFLCQSADWQCVIESEDEESAATEAVESLMSSNSGQGNLSIVISVLKLNNNLIDYQDQKEIKTYYSPVILANAGFHAEARQLDLILQKEDFFKDFTNE